MQRFLPARHLRFVLTLSSQLSALSLLHPLAAPGDWVDSDGDGLSDVEEVAHRTDPKDARSWFPKRLAAWWWDGIRSEWRATAAGQEPVGIPGNETQVPGIVQEGIRLIPAAGRPLRYPTAQADGSPQLRLDRGAVRLWFKPDWAVPRGAEWSAPLVEVGGYLDKEHGWWSWYLHATPQGDLSVKFSQGAADYFPVFRMESRLPAVSWSGTPGWHELALSYGPALTRVYHQNALNVWTNSSRTVFDHGAGIDPRYLPTAAGMARGFQLGMNAAGSLALEGTIDSVETFNYPIGFTETFRLEQLTVRAVEREGRPALEFARLYEGSPRRSGIGSPGYPDPWPLRLQRRAFGSTNWGTPVVEASTEERWIDTTVEKGTRYEYLARLGPTIHGESYRHWVAGIEMPVVHQRGVVLLLVDQTLAPRLKTELAQLRTNLVGDGWRVREWLEAPRHRDGSVESNLANRSKVSRWITDHHEPGATNVVFILGHVTLAHSGSAGWDGHPDHRGGWVCDAFYGYTNRVVPIWTDQESSPQGRNRPGDGILDQNYLPGPPDFAVGRVDFWGLPALGRRSEVDLLRQYLAKATRYREHQIPTWGRVSCLAENPAANLAVLSAQTLSGAAFGVEPGVLFDGYNLRDRVPVDLGVHFQYASAGEAGVFDGLGGSHTSGIFADPARELPVTFRQVWFSYGPDWARIDDRGRLISRDNWLRASLASPNHGLATLGGVSWDYTSLGAGAPLADLMIRGWSRPGLLIPAFQSILGDPTLRLFRVTPPSGLRATRSGRRVTLTWVPSPDADCRYSLSRSTGGLEGFSEPLEAGRSIDGTTFVDEDAPESAVYQVRAIRLQVSGSGSFWNNSQGVFVGF